MTTYLLVLMSAFTGLLAEAATGQRVYGWAYFVIGLIVSVLFVPWIAGGPAE